MENIKRKQTLPKIPKPNAIAQIGKTKDPWASIFVQDVPRMHFIIIWQSQIIAKQLNKLDFNFGVKPILIFKPS